GVHTHTTNSLNTPVGALEFAYPLRMKRYVSWPGPGGGGSFGGGDGLIRDFELLSHSQVTLLCDRQNSSPYGLRSGSAGASGRVTARLPGESASSPLAAKTTQYLPVRAVL